MSENQETHAEVVKLARNELEQHERINCWFRPEFVRALIDRFEAAYKREREGWEGVACSVISDAFQSGKIAVVHEPVGDGAKMREALVQVELFLSRVERHGHPTLNPGDRCDACEGTEELRALVCAALAAPPRAPSPTPESEAAEDLERLSLS